MKRVIHVYKAGHQWRQSPPGIGDFVRGTCHLFEWLQGRGAELRIDLSQTEFAPLIEANPAVFQAGDPARVASAEEWFVDTERLPQRLVQFLESSESELYLCTNLGAWSRTKLDVPTREFVKPFYAFTEEVKHRTREFAPPHYAALSIRSGDKFYGEGTADDAAGFSDRIFRLVEKEILPHLHQRPLVVMSDSQALKNELAKRYGCLTSPLAPQHGAFGNVLPVAVDLAVLKNSSANYHINAWKSWWSGFSHYTSLVFGVPSINFRTPDFAREEVTAAGDLRLPARVRARQQLRRLRSYVNRLSSRTP